MRNNLRSTAVATGLLTLVAAVLAAFDPATGDPPESQRKAGEQREEGKREKGKKKRTRPQKEGKAADYPDGAVLRLTFDADSLCKEGDDIRALDSSGEGNHATLRGAEPDIGRFGGAMTFNGRDTFLEGSDAALPVKTEPSTFTLWFHPRQNKFSGLFAYGQIGNMTARGVACNPSGLVCYFRWKEAACHFKQTLTLDEWHHLAITYDGTKSTLYVDGEEKGSEEKEFDTARKGYIVGRNLNKADWFDGLIDEIALFNRPLTAEEIQTLFKRPSSPAEEKADLATVKACAKP